MGKFDDILANVDLGAGIPDNFITELRAAYTDDLSIPTAKVESLETEKATLLGTLTEKDREITDVKSKNFDLLMQLPKTEDDSSQSAPADTVDDIDDLFD